MKRFEVLSPAGDIENFKVAIKSGADAVYFGLNKFNARLKADNISLDNLQELVDYAHIKGVKTYVTINTLVSGSELRELVSMVGSCLECGVDAFIVQDYGVISVLKSVYPDIVLHGSTQLGVHNVYGAKVAKSLGLSRVVLSREVTIEDIREIKKAVDIELEVFVQGAMCVCFSGNCYLSSLKFGASGNRGLCKQLCRLPYEMTNGKIKKTGYVLSPRDNCMLDYLQELCDIGVESFKIEGRLRRAGYVSTATRVYRQAIDSIISNSNFDKNQAKRDLKKVFSRGEFTSGYFDQKDIIDTRYNSHMGEKIGTVVRCEKFKDLYRIVLSVSCKLATGDGLKFVADNGEIVTVGVGNIDKVGSNTVVYGKNSIKSGAVVYRVLDAEFESNILDLSRKRQVELTAKFVVGEPIKLTAKSGEYTVTALGQVVQAAERAPVSKEKIIENLSKWDKDIFEISQVNFDRLDSNLFVPVSAINEVRRLVSEKLIKEINLGRLLNNVAVAIPQLNKYETVLDTMVIVDEQADISKLKDDYSKFILSPTVYSVAVVSNFYNKYTAILEGRFVINLPIVAMAEDLSVIDEIVDFAAGHNTAIMINNIYGLYYLGRAVKVIAGANMNITNGYAVDALKSMGVEDIVFSCEKWTDRVQGTYKLGSGRRVLMTMAHCPSVTLTGQGCANIKGESSASTCQFKGQMSLYNDNNSYGIRRYKIKNCYFELLDDYREDNATTAVVVDLRK